MEPGPQLSLVLFIDDDLWDAPLSGAVTIQNPDPPVITQPGLRIRICSMKVRPDSVFVNSMDPDPKFQLNLYFHFFHNLIWKKDKLKLEYVNMSVFLSILSIKIYEKNAVAVNTILQVGFWFSFSSFFWRIGSGSGLRDRIQRTNHNATGLNHGLIILVHYHAVKNARW